MAGQLEELIASIRSDPIDMSTANLPAPLSDKEYKVLLYLLKKNRK
jgi:hypothetical protein